MRFGPIAVVPFWSQSDNLNVDSNYAYLRIVLPEMIRQDSSLLFLLFFPDPAHGADQWRFTPDGLEEHERIQLIPYPYGTSMRQSVIAFDSPRFQHIDMTYGPVQYWLHQVESGIFASGGAMQSFNDAARPSLVAQHHYIVHESLPYTRYPLKSLFNRLWQQMGGSLASDVVVYNSGHARSMAHDTFSQFLLSRHMQELEDKSITLPFGLVSGDEPAAPEARQQSPVFIYNHRFEGYKRPDLTFAVLESLSAAGHSFEVWATQAYGQHISGKRYHIDRDIFRASRADYLQICAVPAINTINSEHETFCISILDSMMLGHLIVAPNAVTFPELLPDGYPYLFNSTEEQEAMLASILSTWPAEYNTWRTRLIAHARSHFNLSEYTRNYLYLMQKVEERYRQDKPKEHIMEAYRQLFAAMIPYQPYTPKELRVKLNRLSPTGAGTQAFPARRIIRDALRFRDDIEIVWDRGLKLVRQVQN